MITKQLTPKVLLVAACCLILALALPMSAVAQGDTIKKGAEGVKKGAEVTVEKTKEGAEAVGKGVKKAVTPDDDRDQSDADRMKGSQTEPRMTTPQTIDGEKSETNLPRTGGELPLLILAGILSLGAAGSSRILRRR